MIDIRQRFAMPSPLPEGVASGQIHISSAIFLTLISFLILYYDPIVTLGMFLERLIAEAFGMPLWLYIVLANIVPDIISLAETYLLILLMERFNKVYQVILILVADFLFTVAIYFLVYGVFIAAGTGSVSFAISNSIDTAQNVFYSLPGPGDSINYMNYHTFYTTFVTSIWLWGFALSIVCHRLFQALLGPAWTRLISIFHVENFPLLILAFAGAMLVVLVSALVYPLTFVLRGT